MKFYPPRELVKEEINRDVVIVGDGIAGLSCAITLREYGFKPTVIYRGKGNTYLSQGGLAAAVAEDDSPYLHFLDTIKAGKLLNDEEAVRAITYGGIVAIAKLTSWGVNFDKNETFYELTLEAAHSKRRIFKVKDYTGRAIYEALHKKAKELEIEFIKGSLKEIYTSESKVSGILLQTEDGFSIIQTKILVLATGGAASLYARNSNIQKLGGEAIGTALRAGAILKDTEFVQFHPTVLKSTKYLISEAVRGEGAILVNDKGERFVNELAPRDEVSRAIFQQYQRGNKVFLDFKPLIQKGIKIEEKFPQIYGILKENGLDPYRDLIPVEPAAHYFIGGIATDVFGRTALENLYAVGECANTGFHGANRLASNSLLEGAVMGIRTAQDIAVRLPFIKHHKVYLPSQTPPLEERFDFPVSEVQNILWNNVGIVRSRDSLMEALNRLNQYLEEVNYHAFRNSEALKILDLLLVAKAITINAYRREESRGCHYREDFPKERESFRKKRFEVVLKDLL